MTDEISGFINIYKEKGMTSHDVVASVRKIIGLKKVGHAGTLDPNAEGVLIVGIGKGTKYIRFMEMIDKTYEAEIIFGIETDTWDITGSVIDQKQSTITKEALMAVLPHFYGEILQKPPLFSAIKINGKKLYEYARKGEHIDVPERTVRINQLVCSDASKLPEKARLIVDCSKGTYIRSLCYDIGKALGVPACMGDLCRTRIGQYEASSAYTLSQLSTAAEEKQLSDCLISLEEALTVFETAIVSPKGEKIVSNGGVLYQWNSQTLFDHFSEGQMIRMMGSHGFMGIGQFTVSDADKGLPCVCPVRMM